MRGGDSCGHEGKQRDGSLHPGLGSEWRESERLRVEKAVYPNESSKATVARELLLVRLRGKTLWQVEVYQVESRVIIICFIGDDQPSGLTSPRLANCSVACAKKTLERPPKSFSILVGEESDLRAWCVLVTVGRTILAWTETCSEWQWHCSPASMLVGQWCPGN